MIAKVDDNQRTVVDGLRAIGYSVFSLAPMGKGCGDILVGGRSKNWLFEVKNPEQVRSKRALTPDEKKFHQTWRGQIDTIETWQEAHNIMR